MDGDTLWSGHADRARRWLDDARAREGEPAPHPEPPPEGRPASRAAPPDPDPASGQAHQPRRVVAAVAAAAVAALLAAVVLGRDGDAGAQPARGTLAPATGGATGSPGLNPGAPLTPGRIDPYLPDRGEEVPRWRGRQRPAPSVPGLPGDRAPQAPLPSAPSGRGGFDTLS